MGHMRYATVLFIAALACSQTSTSTTTAPSSSPSIADELHAAGLKVEDAGEVEQPFFPVVSHVYVVEGGDVQVYQFASEEAATEHAAKVSPTGSTIGTSSMHWMAPPHWFRRGSTIVNYLGSNAKVLAELERLMGKQFAGQ